MLMAATQFVAKKGKAWVDVHDSDPAKQEHHPGMSKQSARRLLHVSNGASLGPVRKRSAARTSASDSQGVGATGKSEHGIGEEWASETSHEGSGQNELRNSMPYEQVHNVWPGLRGGPPAELKNGSKLNCLCKGDICRLCMFANTQARVSA
ncbi:hypothetical protein NDU88_006571 [Pleurodeles waltl]|uniref:Uncharacterized protein n=1 Tax=Pleurodeles waltl TaxID=8319 RepID=A0AAV7NQK8_PLEWA|nr:hypothetical protein NDU88_006571 [Pleurodeles waltl]